MRIKNLSFLAMLLLLFASLSFADDEASNRVYVTTSEYGQFYAKSIPAEYYGLKGTTKIYQVGEDEDTLLQTYEWYSPHIFLEGFTGNQTVYVVQMGPSYRGQKANAEDHGIAFYKNDKLLRKYSTLEIVGNEDNVSSSRSHYTVFSNIPGFRRPFGDQLVFDVQTHDGKIISFDTETGNILSKEEEAVKAQLYNAETEISQLKWKWYERKKAELPNINDVVITDDMLKEIAVKDFPRLPDGYSYVPDSMWKPVRLEKGRPGG